MERGAVPLRLQPVAIHSTGGIAQAVTQAGGYVIVQPAIHLPTPSDHAHNRLADADHQCARLRTSLLSPRCGQAASWLALARECSNWIEHRRKQPTTLIQCFRVISILIEIELLGNAYRTRQAV